MSTKEESRERILAAARRLLVEQGYHGAGIEQIARAAGMTRQAVYLHHFPSKAELLLALLEYVDRVEGVAELFRPVQEASTGVEALDLLVHAVAELWPRVGDIARVLDSARLADPAAEIAWQSRAEVRRRGLERLARRLKRENVLAPGWSVAAAADAALMVLSVQSHHLLVREFGWTQAEFERRTTRLLRATLVVETGGGKGARRKPSVLARRGARAVNQ
jgi:AcrR family transcriptional regulator